MPETPKSEILPDARPDNWVDRFAPEGLRPWLKLGRFDRPTGIWLLMLPGWQGVALATSMAGRWPDLLLLAKIFAGAALMRAAGCAYRDLDAKVARTAGRPVASGRISVQQAWAYLVVCSLAAAAILFTLPPLAIGLGIGSLVLVAAYPFMKRITWWPQAWLGLTFNWGALLGFAAVTGEIGLPAILLYLGGVFWTLGYDTIYAVQDMEDDALAGIRSSARRLGPSAPKAVLGVYVLAFLLALACAFTARLGPLFPPLAAGYGLHLSRQAARLDMGDPTGALALFRSNALAGLILFAALAAGQFGQGLWGGGGL
jgi:4-hydroxybenzoate polyprenyltransferase